jgi:predicted DsbA family dithiol-disulfide isomerase
MEWTMNSRTVLYILGLAVVALFTWGIATSTSGGGDGVATPATAREVLATVDGGEITRNEVEANAGAQLAQLRSQIFDLTDQALTQTINERVLDLEAGKRGLETAELIAAVVDSNPPVATEAQIDSVYEANKDRIDQPREAIAPQIEAFLLNQARQARFDSLITSLRDEYDVESYLEPPRFAVAADGPAKGPESAAVTIVEFSDFECPFCKRIVPTLNQIMDDYDGQVRLVFRQFPLNAIHPNAQKAAEASLCADEQGKFWELHDAIFESSDGLGVASLKSRAAEIGLDEAEFGECLDSGRFAEQVAEDVTAGRALGVSGTPALFINGRYLSGAQPYEVIARVIDDELQRGGT